MKRRKSPPSPERDGGTSPAGYRPTQEPLLKWFEPPRYITPASEALENSLHFRWLAGGAIEIADGFRTNVRILPFAIVACSCAPNAAVRFWTENQPERLIEGQVAIFVRPNLAHEFIPIQSGVSLWAHISCTVFGTRDIFSLFEVPEVMRGGLAAEIGNLCRELGGAAKSPEFHPLISACEHQKQGLQLLGLLLAAGRPLPYQNFVHEIERIGSVLQFLEGNLSSPHSRESLARRVNLSPTRFHAVFKSVTGEAPMIHLRRLRLKRASELLLGSTLSIAEIAALVGFADQFHFSHKFKKLFRVSPLQYRQRMNQPLPLA